jgi:hypothetical protein
MQGLSHPDANFSALAVYQLTMEGDFMAMKRKDGLSCIGHLIPFSSMPSRRI